MKKILLLALSALVCFLAVSCVHRDNGIYRSESVESARADQNKSALSDKIEEIKEEYVPKRVSFVAAGDNIVYYGNVLEAASLSGDGERYDFSHQFQYIKDQISSSDVAFINQETLTASSLPLEYYPRFNSPTEVVDCLIEVGFDVINIANNHMLDHGISALRESTDYLRQNKQVFTVGAYYDEADYNDIRIYEHDGVKIAILSYTEFTNMGRGGDTSSFCVPLLREDTLREQIPLAKQVSDIVLVSVHWGNENSFETSVNQRRFASLMCELGADVIIGHHPHVIQTIEWLQSDNGNRTLCAYSLGNLCAEMAEGKNMLGGLLSFDIVKYEEDTVAENVVFTPTVYYFNSRFKQNSVIYLDDFTEELASKHGISYYGNSVSLSELVSYLEKYIPSEFLPENISSSDMST